MRLYSGRIPAIAEEVVSTLIRENAIESGEPSEVNLDIQSVLKEYIRLDREVVEEAKNRLERQGLGYDKLGRMKARVARERNAPPYDEILPYLLTQILNMLFHSQNVEEIFTEDMQLRLLLTPILRKHMENVEEELDREVRSKIRNLEEGTATFEIEYQRAMDLLKRKRGLAK